MQDLNKLTVKKVLYITYDGLTDPLGQSQILPYLKGLSQYGYRFTVLSFEKAHRLEKEGELIKKLTAESGIEWVPLSFTSKPPLLAKLYDALRMKSKAVHLHKKTGFAMTHCRSYIAADVGLYLKKKFGVRFFFDMRGFWADEKKDGSWNVNNPIFKKVYQYYKAKEAEYLQNADYVVSLTYAGKREMMTWPAYNASVPIQVIPCCTDMKHFSLTNEKEKRRSRNELGISNGKLLVSYLGSVGTWYMLDEMLELFSFVKSDFPDAMFLFLTHSDHAFIKRKIKEHNLNPNDFIIAEASRKDVPRLMKASDVNVSFIKPVYSKISSSPTKLGEVLSMGIPVISNSGVGDVEEIVTSTGTGCILQKFTPEQYQKAVAAIPAVLQKDPQSIRMAAEKVYSLDRGIELYLKGYTDVLA